MIVKDFFLKGLTIEWPKIGAGNEIRTRDPDLGKVVLYQLSYSRVMRWCISFKWGLKRQ